MPMETSRPFSRCTRNTASDSCFGNCMRTGGRLLLRGASIAAAPGGSKLAKPARLC
jgi:hypothetical protein